MALAEVKNAIDTYLAAGVGSLVLPYEEIVELYVDNVAGFKKIKEDAEKIIEENGDVVTKEELDEIIEEERKKKVEELKDLKNQAAKELKNKVDGLKASVAEIKNTAADIGKELVKSTADAVVPTSLGPVAPNPISSALRLYINVSRIKRTVDNVLMVVSRALGLIVELGIEETPLAESLTSLAQPLIGIKNQAASKGSKADAVGENPDPAAGYEIIKKDYTDSYPNQSSQKINGIEIEKEVKAKFGNGFPLNDKDKKKFYLMESIKKVSESDKAWAKVILKYNDWYKQNIK